MQKVYIANWKSNKVQLSIHCIKIRKKIIAQQNQTLGKKIVRIKILKKFSQYVNEPLRAGDQLKYPYKVTRYKGVACYYCS